MFITIYGVNNIGKSTHAKRLRRRFEEMGKKAVHIKYPIYDIEPTGPRINEIIRSNSQSISEEELQLWFVMNRFQYEPQLKKHLEEGTIVIAEDYVWTGIAWGASKGANLEWLKAINKPLLESDFSILMHGNREKRAREATHIHESNDALIEQCQQHFLNFADELGWQKVEVQRKLRDTADLLWDAVSSQMP